jgi:hypothetical protein
MSAIESPPPSTKSLPEQIEWILQSFEFLDGNYRRDVVEAAVQLKEEITPHLLDILEDVIKNPKKYADETLEVHSPFYATMLLSYFKEEKAHALLLKAFSLPGTLTDRIFGPLITECLPLFLTNTCAGNIEGIKNLLQNQQAYTYCRNAAAKALLYCVASGFADRQEILKFLAGLFSTESDQSEENEFLSFIAYYIDALFPEPVMDVINAAFKKRQIAQWMVNRKDLEYTIKTSSPKDCIQRLRKELDQKLQKTIHGSMDGWTCLNEKSKPNNRNKKGTPMSAIESPPPSLKSLSDRIDWILNQFKAFDGVYRQDVVQAAIDLKEEITPRLLHILEEVIKDPHKFADEDLNDNTLFFTVTLLSYFNEEKAHPLFIKAFGLPDELPYEIFGDLTTEDLPLFLYRTCSGNIDGIKEFLQNQQVDPYTRSSAADALIYCVAGGLADRHDVLMFLSKLFSTDGNASNKDFLSLIAVSMLDLYPEPVIDVIYSAFKTGLINKGIISKEAFSEAMKLSTAQRSMEKLQQKLSKKMNEDIHDYIKGWTRRSATMTAAIERAFSKLNDKLLKTPVTDFQQTIIRSEPKVGRNDPCPCGSGKKYKKCCLH